MQNAHSLLPKDGSPLAHISEVALGVLLTESTVMLNGADATVPAAVTAHAMTRSIAFTCTTMCLAIDTTSPTLEGAAFKKHYQHCSPPHARP